MARPNDTKATLRSIEHALSSNDYAGAFQHWQEAARQGKLDSDSEENLLYRIALETNDESVRDTATRFYEQTAITHGHSEHHIERLGALYLAAGEKHKAYQLFQRLVKMEAEDGTTRWFARYTMADLLLERGRAEQAGKILMPALKALSPDDSNAAPVIALMGKILLHLGRTKEACYCYDQAMALDTNETSWPKELALGLEKAKDFKPALKYWKALLAIRPLNMGDTVCDGERPLSKMQEYMKNSALAKAHITSCGNMLKRPR